jgi:CO/xanthine dehydrogenase Mo-binding subunit
MPMRASALRSLGAHLNVFATESHIDDMAAACGADPLAYRLRHLDDERGRAVLERVGEMSSWGTPPEGAASGRGLGYARYKNKGAWCAVVADVEAEDSVRLLRMWIAVDAGLVVNPDGVANQIEGGAIQSTSWTLNEVVRFDGGRVLSDTWETYPILTFSQIPMIEVGIVERQDHPPLGAGEASVGPTAAALGNAVFDALGVRVRTMPISAANIIAAMPD